VLPSAPPSREPQRPAPLPPNDHTRRVARAVETIAIAGAVVFAYFFLCGVAAPVESGVAALGENGISPERVVEV
jgi:hypothetical protein